MSSDKLIFVGTGAYIARVDTRTQCGVWLADTLNPPTLYRRDLLVDLDFTRCPSRANQNLIDWSQVQVDDHRLRGGITELGGSLLRGPRVGAVYLEQSFWSGLTAECRPLPIIDGRPYELQTAVYSTRALAPYAGKRYIGTHARVLEVLAPQRVRVEIWNPGRSEVAESAAVTTLELDSPTCDPSVTRGGLTELVAEVDSSGALFLERDLFVELELLIPKVPSTADEGAPLPRMAPVRTGSVPLEISLAGLDAFEAARLFASMRHQLSHQLANRSEPASEAAASHAVSHASMGER